MPQIAAWLAARTLDVAERSLRARVEDDDGGILITANATVSWALDGGALYLYDFAGDLGELSDLLESARAVAAARFAAVLCVTVLDGDPLVGALLERAFERDSEDPEIERGSVRRSVLLVRSLD